MLRKIRIAVAVLFFLLVTLLFLDFTGTLHVWFGWMARIQFLPAVLALHVGIVAALVFLTLLFGRIYCSVICPLGVMQDIVSWFAGRRRKYRFHYRPARTWLRYGVLVLFVAALVAQVAWLAALIAPYSAYGRIASNLFAPLWRWGNNLLALVAEHFDSYAFYTVDVWMKGLGTLLVAAVTFLVIGVLAWRGGRTWCNTICPVGTVLGVLSRFSLFKPRFDVSKCNGCKLCARNCKASCINPEAHEIDYSRCVACMDCLESCRQGAISYVAAATPLGIGVRCGNDRSERIGEVGASYGEGSGCRSLRSSCPGPLAAAFPGGARDGGRGGNGPGTGDEGRRRTGPDRGEEDTRPRHAADPAGIVERP